MNKDYEDYGGSDSSDIDESSLDHSEDENNNNEINPGDLTLARVNGSLTLVKKRKQPEQTTTTTTTTTITRDIDDKEFRANIIPFSISLPDITKQLQNDSTTLAFLHKKFADQLNRLKVEEKALVVQQKKKENERDNNFLNQQ